MLLPLPFLAVDESSFAKKILTLHSGRESNCRVPLRSNNNANANGGVVYANANNAGSNSNTNNGVRLTLKV